MPQRLTTQELAFELARSVWGDVPDVSESREEEDE